MANYEKAGKKNLASKYNDLLTAGLNEVGIFDDMWRGMTAEQIWDNWLFRGEIFGCWKDELPVGFLALTNIVLGRHATKFGYLIPSERNHFQFENQLLEYAFKEYPAGLSLVKIKSFIPTPMIQTLQGFTSMGDCVGNSPYDGLFGGQPSDMLQFELYSPLIQAAEVLDGGIINRTTEERTGPADASLHASSAVPESGGLSVAGGLRESGGSNFGSNVVNLQPAISEPNDDSGEPSGGGSSDGLTDLERQLSSFA